MHHILIIDDDPDDLQWLNESLTSICSSCAVQLCTTIAEALALLEASDKTQMPCIIVLDYQLPKVSAIEAIALLNKVPGIETVRKVVWSTSPHFKEQSLQAGASHYVVKPFSADEMQKITTDILSICHVHID